MHATNPSQKECLGLNILELNSSKQFYIQRFKFLINDNNDSLQNRRIIFGVWVYDSFQVGICLGFVHLVLNAHYFIKYTIYISLGVFYTIK